jgi:hypothetical protein
MTSGMFRSVGGIIETAMEQLEVSRLTVVKCMLHNPSASDGPTLREKYIEW